MKQWVKVKPHFVQAQGPPLSAKLSFVRIDPVDRTLSGVPTVTQSHSVNLVFLVSSYVLVLRFSLISPAYFALIPESETCQIILKRPCCWKDT